MGEPRKVIRDYRFEPDKALAVRKAVIAEQQKRYGDDPRLIIDGGKRVIPPYYPREPINAGDEMSPSGVKVELSELADDVLVAISTAFTLREVVLGKFTAMVVPGTAINVQTGVYAGAGSPVPVTGDLNVVLSASGAAFKDDGRIEILLNGQELTKGDGTGNGVAEWASSTQIKLSIAVKVADEILVRAPFPPA